jgi:hypothetical protein
VSDLEGSVRASRRVAVSAFLGLVLVLVACWFGGRMVLADDEPAGPPLSAAEYARVLAEVDASLREPFRRLAGDRGAYPAAADGLRSGAERLATTIPPHAVAPAHDALFAALRRLAIVVDEAARATPACPAASPATVVLASTHAGQVRARAKELATADATWVFGAFLPAPAPEQHRRLRNGALIKRPSGDGVAALGVESGPGLGDTAVSLVREGSGKPVGVVYVREGATAELKGISPGSYRVLVASGDDWDPARKGFTRACEFTKFNDRFDFGADGAGWTVTLTTSLHGNAAVSDLDPKDFAAE